MLLNLQDMIAQRDELTGAIEDLRQQLKWGEQRLSEIKSLNEAQ